MRRLIFGVIATLVVLLIIGRTEESATNIRNIDKSLLVDHLRSKFEKFEEELWKEIDLGRLSQSTFKEKPQEVVLIEKFEKFGDKFSKEYPHNVTYGLKDIGGVWAWARLYTEITTLTTMYEAFRRFQTLQTTRGRIPSPTQAWEQLSDTILMYSNNAPELLRRISEIADKEKVFAQVLKEVEGGMICNTHQSPQQLLMNLYSTIATSELKGYTMVQYAYMFLTLHGKGNFTEERKFMHNRYRERESMLTKALQKAMETASRDMWRCDPKKHIKGQTYEEITELLQGYLQNEVDLNPEGTCGETCGDYTYTKSHGCFKNLWCQKQRNCEGKIINCKFYDSDMWVCPAGRNSGRRYEYIEYENGKVLGRKMGCAHGLTSVDSWWRWLFWHCSYCMCICDDPGRNSDRYFNLRPYISDLNRNMVVTGLRFRKLNRIIHLQIQQGKLLPRGAIDPESLQWVPLHDYTLTDRDVYNKQDYHMMNWENRAIDLDDLVADSDHVVTGIRFKLLGSHLNFEIFNTPFNFATGELIDPDSRSFWKDNPNTDVSLVKKPRKQLSLSNADIPTRSLNPSILDSKSDMYLQFTHTGFDVDVAQTTVPFIDTQEVESFVPVPLSGAGIYHKGRRGFGGFVAPKIITYDYTKHIALAAENDKYDVEHEKNIDPNSNLFDVDFVPAN